jgi:hypothetical protein
LELTQKQIKDMSEADKNTPASAEKKARDEIAARRLLDEARAQKLQEAQVRDRPATVPLAPGETQGEQTRGGPRLGETPAGKELVGMRSGIPIYVDTAEVYGAPKPSISNTIANTPAAADSTKPVMIQGQTIEQQRAEYQAREAPKAAAAMATPEDQAREAPKAAAAMATPEPKKYWGSGAELKYGDALARQAALARVGGAEEAKRRSDASEESAKNIRETKAFTEREVARQKIEAGTASPDLIESKSELNPLRATGKDAGKRLTQEELDLINARIFRSRLPQAEKSRVNRKAIARRN